MGVEPMIVWNFTGEKKLSIKDAIFMENTVIS